MHTPGPWKIATTYANAQAGKYTVVPWATQRQRVCAIAARPNYPPAQAEADARLIAAAPELLACLQEAAFPGGPSQKQFGAWLIEARAAIAKATGD